MGLFDKVAKTAQNVGRSVNKTAANVGSNASVAAQEQTELVELRSQVNVINQELDSAYVQIGRKYVDYVMESGEMPGIDVSDILKMIDPKMTKKLDIEKRIIQLEKEIKQKDILREKAVVEEEFLAEKSKLDKALGMELLSQDEYDAKLAIAKKKVDNFVEIRRIKQQAEMGLITEAEKNAKLNALLS